MERTHAEQIGDLIERLIKEYNLEKPAGQQKACWLWGQVVGPGINQRTTRRQVKDGVLHVWIDSAPLKNELQFQRQSICSEINKQLNGFQLTDIQIH